MIVSATELKSNLGKYLELAARQDIFITRNGRNIARLTSPAIDKLIPRIAPHFMLPQS